MATQRALLVVDVQPTFCEGGALGVEGGNAVAEQIARYTAEHRDRYDLVVTTQDWHIDPGDHFSDNPDFIDTWPPHGVAGTAEAELHPALVDLAPDDSVKKGEYEAAYSGFEGTNPDGEHLAEILQRGGITAVDVVGLAESHCVKETALDAIKSGLRARVLTDLTEPVSAELGQQARERMAAAGVELVPSGAL
ncbi:isochorismatase family protein [Pseudactinotalea sp. Z1739]|uniref:isochorismatase family protein n=1 Tax=Pseudactinotalea sp. Z1739 TaxID=3413028 RepID=UPI003C79BFD4